MQYLRTVYPPGQIPSAMWPVISIGWGVPLYLVGAILPIIAGCIWLGLSYSIVEKAS